jgi:hypothetical protein
MRTQLLAALSVLSICGAVSAQTTTLPSIEVRAGTTESVMVSCAKPDSVTREDVERVLSVDDASMTRALRNKFVAAASEACKQGVAHIQVTSDDKGNLSWKKME